MQLFGIEFFEQERSIILKTKNDLVRFNNILYFNSLER
jgi:hypothetical protein